MGASEIKRNVPTGALSRASRVLKVQRRGARQASCQDAHAAAEIMPQPDVSRRPLMLGALALLGAWDPRDAARASAAESAITELTWYEDSVDKFGFSIPADWVQAEGTIANEGGFAGATGARRTIAFFPPNQPASVASVSVTVTNVSFEFTKLGSFGNVATFAGNLVNSLDQSYLLRRPSWAKAPTEPIQVANLIDYKESNEQYMVEYTVQKIPDPQRHLLSKIALGNNGVYNRLYTLTAQCSEDDLPKYLPTFQTAMNTFTANVKPQY